MGNVTKQRPVLLIAAVFSRYPDALTWGEEQMVSTWGPIVLRSEPFEFSQTSFYRTEMGTDLQKRLVAFENLIDPASIASMKHQSNQWETEFVERSSYPESRPLNLDPGYLTEAKLVLATTKNRDHRIYLQDGIFAEITLFFQGGKWQSSRWTYPDYQRQDVHQFLQRCRDYLRKRYEKLRQDG